MIHPKGPKWILFLLLKVSISGSLLYYIFQVTPLDQIIKTLSRATPSFVLFALSFFCLERIIMAFQLKRIMDSLGMGLTTIQIFRINLITTFYELFLPGSVVTGAIRWYKLSQLSKMKIPTLAAIGINRLVHFVVIILVGGVCWMVVAKPTNTMVQGLLFFLLFVAFFIVYSLLLNKRIFGSVLSVSERAIAKYIPMSMKNSVLKLTEALKTFHDLTFKEKLEIFWLQLGGSIFSIMGWFLLAQGLMISVSPFTFGWIRSFLTMLVIIPIHIAGLGIRELSLTMVLPMYGVTLDEALALSFLLFFTKVFWGTIGGIFEGWNLFVLGEKPQNAKQFSQQSQPLPPKA